MILFSRLNFFSRKREIVKISRNTLGTPCTRGGAGRGQTVGNCRRCFIIVFFSSDWNCEFLVIKAYVNQKRRSLARNSSQTAASVRASVVNFSSSYKHTRMNEFVIRMTKRRACVQARREGSYKRGAAVLFNKYQTVRRELRPSDESERQTRSP